MSPSAARAANIANAPLPNAYNAALVGVWCLVAGVVKHLAGLGAFAYFYATRTDTADMLNPSTWGATELVLMGAAVTAGQFLINVVLFAVDACTKTLGPGVVGRIPISGHHLDELGTKDRLMVLINAIQTVPFTYHVACYVWASPRVEWAPEKLTLVNGPVAFLGFFVIYDLFTASSTACSTTDSSTSGSTSTYVFGAEVPRTWLFGNRAVTGGDSGACVFAAVVGVGRWCGRLLLLRDGGCLGVFVGGVS